MFYKLLITHYIDLCAHAAGIILLLTPHDTLTHLCYERTTRTMQLSKKHTFDILLLF